MNDRADTLAAEGWTGVLKTANLDDDFNNDLLDIVLAGEMSRGLWPAAQMSGEPTICLVPEAGSSQRWYLPARVGVAASRSNEWRADDMDMGLSSMPDAGSSHRQYLPADSSDTVCGHCRAPAFANCFECSIGMCDDCGNICPRCDSDICWNCECTCEDVPFAATPCSNPMHTGCLHARSD